MPECFVFPIEMYNSVTKTLPSVAFILDNTRIEIKSSFREINDEYFDTMPNLYEYTKNEKKIKSYKYNEIIMRQSYSRTLVIMNSSIGYFELFVGNKEFRDSILKTYHNLTFDPDVDIMLDCNNIVRIDFNDFVAHVNKMLENSVVYGKHNSYLNWRILFGSIDCMNNILGYIEFSNLCKIRSTSTNFMYIIEGCTVPPKSLKIMNSLSTEFSYGCLYNINKNNILYKYDECIKKYTNYIQENNIHNQKLHLKDYMRRIINEYIVIKVMVIHGSSLANNLVDYLDDRFHGDDSTETVDSHRDSLQKEYDWNNFLDKTFVDMSILGNFLEKKLIHDLYSLVNFTIVNTIFLWT